MRACFSDIPDDVNFTFIADCCHSGTIQKGLLEGDVDFVGRFIVPPPEISDRIEALRVNRDNSRNSLASAKLTEILQDTPKDQWEATIAAFLDPMQHQLSDNRFGFVEQENHVLLAACEDKQTAADARIEGDYRGAFTWAISKSINEANGDLTYGRLIELAGAHLRRYEQRPQLECPEALRELRLFEPLG